MKCRRIEELIPLFVEDDLEPRRKDLVSDHLKSCPSCEVLAREFGESQRWLRRYVPRDFDASFFDEMGKEVRAHLAEASGPSVRERIFGRFWGAQFAFAVGVLLVLLSGTALLISRTGPRANGLSVTLAGSDRPAEDGSAPTDNPPGTLTPQQLDQKPVTLPIQKLSPGRAHKSAPRTQVDAASAVDMLPSIPWEFDRVETVQGALEAPEPIRIYIQTSDPNIRIIWLVSKPVDGD